MFNEHKPRNLPIKKPRPKWLDRLKWAPYQIKIKDCTFRNIDSGIRIVGQLEPKPFSRYE